MKPSRNGNRALAGAAVPTAAASAGSSAGLARQLASKELLGEAEVVIGTPMAGAGASGGREIRDVYRLVNECGGDASNWAKMTTRTRVAGGASISVHWYETSRQVCVLSSKLQFSGKQNARAVYRPATKCSSDIITRGSLSCWKDRVRCDCW